MIVVVSFSRSQIAIAILYSFVYILMLLLLLLPLHNGFYSLVMVTLRPATAPRFRYPNPLKTKNTSTHRFRTHRTISLVSLGSLSLGCAALLLFLLFLLLLLFCYLDLFCFIDISIDIFCYLPEIWWSVQRLVFCKSTFQRTLAPKTVATNNPKQFQSCKIYS